MATVKKIVVTIFAIFLIIISIVVQNTFTYKRSFYRYEQHKDSLKASDSGDTINGTLISHLPIISINTGEQLVPGNPIYDELVDNL